jgi:glycine cleavage system protein P-like pyridoxal-binding family
MYNQSIASQQCDVSTNQLENLMITLTPTTDSFDQDNTFTFEYVGTRGRTFTATGYLADYGDEGIYIMKKSACLKANYTQKDMEECARLNAMEPVRDGDHVLYNLKQYQVKILGNFSDAGRLI